MADEGKEEKKRGKGEFSRKTRKNELAKNERETGKVRTLCVTRGRPRVHRLRRWIGRAEDFIDVRGTKIRDEPGRKRRRDEPDESGYHAVRRTARATRRQCNGDDGRERTADRIGGGDVGAQRTRDNARSSSERFFFPRSVGFFFSLSRLLLRTEALLAAAGSYVR